MTVGEVSLGWGRVSTVAGTLALAVIGSLLAGCGVGGESVAELDSNTRCSDSLEPGVVEESGEFDGRLRSWRLAVPSDPVGIIFSFHGTGGSIEAQDAITNLSAEGTARGYVVVTPQGLEAPERWTVPGIPGPDDISFVSDLLAQVRQRGCIDGPAFATGHSSGASMSTQLACETDLFTGVAPVAGVSLYRRCPTGQPISVLSYHGTEDNWVPYEGPDGWEEDEANDEGYFIGDPVSSMASFAERAGCDPDPSSEPLGDDTTVLVWSCPDGHRVEFYTVEGAGHSHPGQHARDTYRSLGNLSRVEKTTATFDGTAVMLDFFDSVRSGTSESRG